LLIFTNEANQLWLEQRPPSGIWGGLWSFPQVNIEEADGRPAGKQIGDLTTNTCGGTAEIPQTLPTIRHSFSHYHLEMTPVMAARHCAYTNRSISECNGKWFSPEELEITGLPAPIKKLVGDLLSKTCY
jgi:A/G-specific adenine glycosylase